MSKDLDLLSNKIFVQGDKIGQESTGIASYHFKSGSPYISYSFAKWKQYDGSSPPNEKYFENWSYDA
jgi:hypothetical protein